MLGQRAIYHEGWLACTLHPPISGWGHFEHDVWELYHLAEDRAQARNVAAEHPERVERLKQLWFYYAGIYNGLPLDDRSALEIVLAERPHPSAPRDRYVYYPNCADVPEEAGVPINGRSFTIAAGVQVDSPDAHGVLYAHGGLIGGHSLYVKDRRLRYTYNWIGTHLQDLVADREVTPGRHVYIAEFSVKGPNDDPQMPGFAGTLTLYVDNEPVGKREIVTQPGHFCLVGDGICVGRDSASPVTPEYDSPFPFTGGTIDKVVVDVSGEQYLDHEKEVMAWIMRD
jgi:arylsulfatase